jgi:O-methyltransferase involved in polyketide biosynthesis
LPCDFERDSLRARLVAGGFAPRRPSLVIWVGVSQYVSRCALQTTLADLEALCAPGSRLVFEYIDPDVIAGTTRWKGARRVTTATRLRGEPFRTGLTDADVDALLAGNGFESPEHVRVAGWLQRYAPTYLTKPAGND